MRRNHTPYLAKRLYAAINRFYVHRFIAPQFDSLGDHPEIAHPRSLIIFGSNIHAGKFLQIICAADNCVRLTTWPGKSGSGSVSGEIRIGNYCLVSPGVRISAAQSICIGDNVMLAANVYISDSDWHGVYNRIRPFRCTKPVVLENNVWLGEGVIVNKGVRVGENSIVGAGAVVTRNIPANCIAGGNPAEVIKTINPQRRMLKREFMFQDPERYFYLQDQMDKYTSINNSGWRWLRTWLKPSRKD